MSGGMETLDREQTSEPQMGMGGGARVVVLNDDHNTFEGVAAALARIVPGIDFKAGLEVASVIHRAGRACVWQGEFEVAELYWEQLRGSGLTMAPLERG